MKIALFAIAAIALAQNVVKTQEAISIQRDWQEGDPIPSPGENGTVVYQYGAAMPPIVCAPARLTTVLFERGEKIAGEPILGDTKHWYWHLLTYGAGPTARMAMILKPNMPGYPTDLVIATDRRGYQLHLIGSDKDHLSQVEFDYPSTGNYEQYRAQQEAEQRATVKKEDHPAATLNAAANFRYTVHKKAAVPFAPKTVYDDGAHTYLKMSPEASHWDAPVLAIAGPNGCEIVSYHVMADTWIIDRLFYSADLVTGTGKKALRVTINRDGMQPQPCGKAKLTNYTETAKK